MAGGILQLLFYGAEDMYLTTNPQITFFKIVYRKHTNFSFQTFERFFQDNPSFGKKSTIEIQRTGDLIHQMFLKVTINAVELNEGEKFAWTRKLGHALLKSIEIVIGGQVLDRQYGIWLDIWYELARNGYHERGYAIMIGDVPMLTEFNEQTKPQYNIFIPLKFWFNKFVGLALPTIAIQYHQIFINVEFQPREKLIITNDQFNNINNVSILEASLLIDFIYLDVIEREKFSTMPHEYLIEQIQFTGERNFLKNIERLQLDFTFPTKELFWIMNNGNYISNKKFLCYTHLDDWTNEIIKCSRQLLLNSIILLNSPVFVLDQYGNFKLDQYGNRIINIPGEQPPNNGDWEEFQILSNGFTKNDKIEIINNSDTYSFWVNTNSLLINDYSITSKITAKILINNNNQIIIQSFDSDINERDVSIPIELMIDTRINSDDICVNLCTNFGTLINGKINPYLFSMLLFNDQERIGKRNGNFFNYLQPEMHHNNTPTDGINVYSFCLEPEKLQPTGTANLSRIEKIIINLTIGDLTERENLPNLNIINENSKIMIFALNYNVLKISNGLVALAYSD